MAERPTQELVRWRKGDGLTAKRLNKTVDAVNRIVGGVRPPRQTVSAPLSAGAPGKSSKQGPIVAQFKVVSVEDDFLVCNDYDGLAASDVTTLVAKPYLLRRTPFDLLTRDGVEFIYGDAVERIAFDGEGTSETQRITPSYVAGDIIYAVRNIVGKTDVDDTDTESDDKLDWLDLNVDGRSWAEVVA